MSSPESLTKFLSLLPKPFCFTHQMSLELNNIERSVFKGIRTRGPKRGIKVKQIPQHLYHSPLIPKDPSISLSPDNPKQCETSNLPPIGLPKSLYEMIIMPHTLLVGTQSILVYMNKLCHCPKVIGQCRKIWSIDSPLLIRKMHQSRLRNLKSLLDYSMSLVFTFLYTTNQAKVLS